MGGQVPIAINVLSGMTPIVLPLWVHLVQHRVIVCSISQESDYTTVLAVQEPPQLAAVYGAIHVKLANMGVVILFKLGG